ncbi:MAG: DUF4835 family protein [Bacteroidota bacterium]
MAFTRPLLVAFLLVLLAPSPAAQELNCQVSINRQALSGSEFGYLDEMRTEIQRYLNGRIWTTDAFEASEQIECQFQITFTRSLSLTDFGAQLVVQASRPIYGTASRTTTFRVLDETWSFRYTRGQPLIYDPNRFDALTSVLDFYANLILGYDYDSFSALGGTPYFERALRVAELARSDNNASDPGAGWFGQGAEDRVRYTLVQELLDPTFEPLRQAHYAYHFDVLDHFLVRPEQSYEAALTVLESLHELYQLFNRRRYTTDVFYGVKYQELTALLRDAPQRNQAYALLAEMDAAHLGTYDDLVN